jgi:hypothetical protein
MRKLILLFIFIISWTGNALTQEWFSSLEVAGRLAIVQNKMLFVMWEDSFDYPYYVSLRSKSGSRITIDITRDTYFDEVIWTYFVPVKISESRFPELSAKIKETRGLRYYNKLADDSIKIMDANGNILNIADSDTEDVDLSSIIEKYALKTTFLKNTLRDYSTERNFRTSFRLASKYVDFALFVPKDTRYEIFRMADIYFDESRTYAQQGQSKNIKALLQKIDLLKIKEYLILNRPRKVLRQLKTMEASGVDTSNQYLVAFLKYTAFKLLKDEENAALWESEVSLVDLKKANLILNIAR